MSEAELASKVADEVTRVLQEAKEAAAEAAKKGVSPQTVGLAWEVSYKTKA